MLRSSSSGTEAGGPGARGPVVAPARSNRGTMELADRLTVGGDHRDVHAGRALSAAGN